MPDRSDACGARTTAILAVILGTVSIALHGCFSLQWIGEQDQARLINQAALGYQEGVWHIQAYPIRVSPLYLFGLRSLLQAGVELQDLPSIMNWANAIAAGFITSFLFLIVRRMVSSSAALCTVALYNLLPAFWVGSIYGMPHLPSLAFLLIATWCTMIGVGSRAALRWGAFLGATLAMAVACALKADVILCGGALLATTIYMGNLRRSDLVASLLIPLIGLGCAMAFSRGLVPVLDSTNEFAREWNTQFPFTWKTILSGYERSVTYNSFGKCLFVAVAIGCIYCATRKKYHRLLAATLIWGGTPFVFWGLKFGNSARHLASGALPFTILVSALICCLVPRWHFKLLLVIGLLSLNYASSYRRPDTVSPSSRIFETPQLINASARDLHMVAKSAVEVEATDLAIVGSAKSPYAIYELLASSASNFQFSDGMIILTASDGSLRRIRHIYGTEAIERFRSESWVIWSMENGIEEAPGAPSPPAPQ